MIHLAFNPAQNCCFQSLMRFLLFFLFLLVLQFFMILLLLFWLWQFRFVRFVQRFFEQHRLRIFIAACCIKFRFRWFKFVGFVFVVSGVGSAPVLLATSSRGFSRRFRKHFSSRCRLSCRPSSDWLVDSGAGYDSVLHNVLDGVVNSVPGHVFLLQTSRFPRVSRYYRRSEFFLGFHHFGLVLGNYDDGDRFFCGRRNFLDNGLGHRSAVGISNHGRFNG